MKTLAIACLTALVMLSCQQNDGSNVASGPQISSDVVVFCEGTGPQVESPGCPDGSTISPDACSKCTWAKPPCCVGPRCYDPLDPTCCDPDNPAVCMCDPATQLCCDPDPACVPTQSECGSTVTQPRVSPCSGWDCLNKDVCPCGSGPCAD